MIGKVSVRTLQVLLTCFRYYLIKPNQLIEMVKHIPIFEINCQVREFLWFGGHSIFALNLHLVVLDTEKVIKLRVESFLHLLD